MMTRNPNLATVQMVEEFIQKHNGEYNRTQLWKKLPKKMMYQTYKKVINYLVESKKIILDRDGKLIWIFDPELFNHLMKRSVKV